MSVTCNYRNFSNGSTYVRGFLYWSCPDWSWSWKHNVLDEFYYSSSGERVPLQQTTLFEQRPGPFRPDDYTEPIRLRDNFGRLQNNCRHVKFDGVLYHDPSSATASLFPGVASLGPYISWPASSFRNPECNYAWFSSHIEQHVASVFTPPSGYPVIRTSGATVRMAPYSDRTVVTRITPGNPILVEEAQYAPGYVSEETLRRLYVTTIHYKDWSKGYVQLRYVMRNALTGKTVDQNIVYAGNDQGINISYTSIGFSTFTSSVCSESNFTPKRLCESTVYEMLDGPCCTTPRVHDYYPATKMAMESLGTVDVNNLENLKDLPDVKSLVPSKYIKYLKSGKPKLVAKALSGLYLWYSFGVKPLMSDATKMAKSRSTLSNNGSFSKHGTSHSQVASTTWTYNVTIYGQYAPANITQRLDDKLRSVGCNPSLENFWDLIPFSFVIDWFLPVGNLLGSFDVSADVCFNRYNVGASCYSSKGTQMHALNKYGFSGNLKYTAYERHVSVCAPLSRSNSGLYDPNQSSHWSTGAALIVNQTMK